MQTSEHEGKALAKILNNQLKTLVALLLLSSFAPLRAQENELRISTEEEIKAGFDSVPCKNDDRMRAAKAVFENMGAAASDVSVDKHKDVENLIVRKQGTTKETIIIGAHYDKAGAGCGAVDNWTGIVAMAHLFRSLKTAPLKKSVLFVAFGREEEGLIGSRAMADAIPVDQLPQHCEMINIDSLGLGAPQVATNMSHKKLSAFTAKLAADMGMPFGEAGINGADSDSSSFLRKSIPALTIHGLIEEWPRVLHGKNDQVTKVNPLSVYLGYRLALALVFRLDNLPCQEFKSLDIELK